MSSFGIDLRKEGTSENYMIGKELERRDSQPKEAQSVVVEKKENKNCEIENDLLLIANFIEWKVGDRCEALYKDDNKYYPGR